ncbi:DUF5596 domain-containing protein [Streptomyces sp. PSKA28]|uniref:DUF5596 domain-containing protein n=2 Tax=Streptomyces TaxID=1883 RepID=A0A7W0DV50_9ACTN|nr:DUF5596 domain-containing protein [Streptomyces himalayensis subsp. himalayensis]
MPGTSDVLDVLRGDEGTADWLREMESAGEPGVEAVIPSAEDLPDILLDLAVPHEDINELVGLRERVAGDPAVRWLLKRCVSGLVRDMGEIGRGAGLRSLPEQLGLLGRCFAVYVFVAALPSVRAYHRARGIPDDVSRRTLADLGRHMAVHRRRRGTSGLLAPGWLALHFHGELYQLGRLQFERTRLGQRTGQAIAAAGAGPGAGGLCLNLHISDFRGPLSPAACDQSLALAREFFPRHFPEERYEAAVCHSWLLDPQLKRLLPEESNIVRFQKRFRVAYEETEPADSDPVAFVFGDPDLPVAELPRRSSVERAIGDHLRAGGHWYGGHGWFPL